MDIPIQVAVRIYKQRSVRGAEARKYDDDGNPLCDDINGNEGEEEEEEAEDTDTGSSFAECDGDERDVRHASQCCVQAVPMPNANLPTPTAVPGSGGQHGDIAAGFIQVGPHSFPVTHALAPEVTQGQLYQQAVLPLLALFLDGFDASIVTYGQARTGKSYTLYGPLAEHENEIADGIVLRCVRDVYAHIARNPARTYDVKLTFAEIHGERVRDMIGGGGVQCKNANEVRQWLRNCRQATTEHAHVLCSLSLEQHWVEQGLIQHRESTFSFTDLGPTERQINRGAPADGNLLALEQVVDTLTEPALVYQSHGSVPYMQSPLTTMLKDSFGGRAQTLLIVCVSPAQHDISETLANLQFAFKVQCVRNYVTMNTFSDDNTPATPEHMRRLPSTQDFGGLKFAATQWLRLVASAEGILSNLVLTNAVPDAYKAQIGNWLFHKQEIMACINSNQALLEHNTATQTAQHKEVKQDDDGDDDDNGDDGVGEQSSASETFSSNDSDSDCESQQPDFTDKLEQLVAELVLKNDCLNDANHERFLHKQPKPVMESQSSFGSRRDSQQQRQQQEQPASLQAPTEEPARLSVSGRRRSIPACSSLSSADIVRLNRVATRQQQQQPNDAQLPADVELPIVAVPERNVADAIMCTVLSKLRKLEMTMKARGTLLAQLEDTLAEKEKTYMELFRNTQTVLNAERDYKERKHQLVTDLEKAKTLLSQAADCKDHLTKIDRRRAVRTLEKRIKRINDIRQLTKERMAKTLELKKDLEKSRRVISEQKAKFEADELQHVELEQQLQAARAANTSVALARYMADDDDDATKSMHMKTVSNRLSYLDHVLREKANNLEQCRRGDAPLFDTTSLRHEIRNLRRTKDQLIEERSVLDRKQRFVKRLTDVEERKKLEYEEAIEAIDASIECKNEMICGRDSSLDMRECAKQDEGAKLLMADLSKLSDEELRVLLYKYFNKVIDLRESTTKMEKQLIHLEREREGWEWKERVLSNAVRQARLEGERNAVILQRQHEHKLMLLMRHLAEDALEQPTDGDASCLVSRTQRDTKERERGGSFGHKITKYIGFSFNSNSAASKPEEATSLMLRQQQQSLLAAAAEESDEPEQEQQQRQLAVARGRCKTRKVVQSHAYASRSNMREREREREREQSKEQQHKKSAQKPRKPEKKVTRKNRHKIEITNAN